MIIYVLMYYIQSLSLYSLFKCIDQVNILYITGMALVLETLGVALFMMEMPKFELKNAYVIITNSVYYSISNFCVSSSKSFVYVIFKSFTPIFVDLLCISGVDFKNLMKVAAVCVSMGMSLFIPDPEYVLTIGTILTCGFMSFVNALRISYINKRVNYIEIDSEETFPYKELRIMNDTNVFMALTVGVFCFFQFVFHGADELQKDLPYAFPVALLGVFESLFKYKIGELFSVRDYSYIYVLKDMLFCLVGFIVFSETSGLDINNYMFMTVSFLLIMSK